MSVLNSCECPEFPEFQSSVPDSPVMAMMGVLDSRHPGFSAMMGVLDSSCEVHRVSPGHQTVHLRAGEYRQHLVQRILKVSANGAGIPMRAWPIATTPKGDGVHDQMSPIV